MLLVQILIVKQEMKLLILVAQKQRKKVVAVNLFFPTKFAIFTWMPDTF